MVYSIPSLALISVLLYEQSHKEIWMKSLVCACDDEVNPTEVANSMGIIPEVFGVKFPLLFFVGVCSLLWVVTVKVRNF